MVVPTTLLLVPKDHGRHHYFIVHQTHSLQKRERRDPVRKRNGTSTEKGCFNRTNPSMSFRAHRPAPKGNHSFASGRLYLGIARKARPALLLAERSHRVERPSFLASTNVGLLRKSIGQARLIGNPVAYQRTEGKCTGARVRFKMPDSDDSSLFSDSSEEGVPERDPVEFARSVWNEYGDDHTMIAALLGEEAVRDGPPVLQAARTRTTRDIQRDNQGDTEMQDAPGAGDNAGDAPNPPDDGAAGQGPPDAGQPNPGGGGGGGGGFVRPGIGTHPPHRMDSVFAACMFSKEAADMAIHVYNVSSGDILAYLREADCQSLCTSIQRPYNMHQGGRGFPVGPIQSGRLKLAAHLFKHHMRSTIEYPYDATEQMILDFDPQYQVEVNYKRPADSEIPKLKYDTFAADLKVFTATMTNGTFRGVHGTPIGYVFRKNTRVEPELNRRPVTHTPDGQSYEGALMVKRLINFNSTEAQCEAALEAGEGQPSFHADNAAFHDILTVAVRDDPTLLILMQPTERSKDGRRAYKALYERCLGQNYVKTQINAINAQIRSTQYNGEQGNSNWKAFDTIHRNARNKLNFFKSENPNYAGLDDGTHCSQILTNIHAKELDAAISTIRANKLDENFDVMMNFLAQHVTPPSKREQRRLAATSQAGRAGGRGGGSGAAGRGNGGGAGKRPGGQLDSDRKPKAWRREDYGRVPDEIFNTWSQAEKDKYNAERKEHNRRKPRGGSGGRGNRGGGQLAVLSTRMDELSRSISQLTSHGDGSSSTSRSHRRSDGGTRQARRSPSRSRDRRDSE